MLFPPPAARGVPWDGASYDALNLLGAKPAGMLGGHAPAVSTLGTGLVSGSDSPAEGQWAKPWHPDSPMFWFGTLLAVTFGLIGVSTSVRVGPFKGALSAGKST